MERLRTWCNQNGISCRDDQGRLLTRPALVRRAQQTGQVGGAMSKDKAWVKYGQELRARLAADKSYTEPLESKLTEQLYGHGT